MNNHDQHIDFEDRKELIKNLQGGEKIIFEGKEYTFDNVDNPYFPHYVHLKNAEGEVKILPFEDARESIRASLGGVLKPESPRSFSAYKKHHGELDLATYNTVMNCSVSQDDYAVAMRILSEFSIHDHETVDMVARLIGTLKGDKRTKHAKWLMTEVMLLLGRF